MPRNALSAFVLVVAVTLLIPAAPSRATPPYSPANEDPISREYGVASVLVGGANLVTSVVNFTSLGETGPPGWAAYAGVVGGVIGMGLGGRAILEYSSPEPTSLENADDLMLGVANLIVGTVSTIAGAARIVRAGRSAEVAKAMPDPDAVTITAGLQTGRVSGVGIRMQF